MMNLIGKGIMLSALILVFAACQKKGCTDADADNYNEDAAADDGSCLYGIDMTFYMSESTAAALTDAGATPPLSLEIGSPTISTMNIGSLNWEEDSTYASAPSCGSSEPFTFNIRYQDYTKGSTTAALTGTYGDGSSAYNIGVTLNLGANDCAVRSF